MITEWQGGIKIHLGNGGGCTESTGHSEGHVPESECAGAGGPGCCCTLRTGEMRIAKDTRLQEDASAQISMYSYGNEDWTVCGCIHVAICT